MIDQIFTSMFGGSAGGGGAPAGYQPPTQPDWWSSMFQGWNLHNAGVIDPWDPSSEEFWKKLRGPAYRGANTAPLPPLPRSAALPADRAPEGVAGPGAELLDPAANRVPQGVAGPGAELLDPAADRVSQGVAGPGAELVSGRGPGVGPRVIQAVANGPRTYTADGFGARVSGTIKVNGNTYRFVNGGVGRGSIPFDTYEVGRFTPGSQRAAEGFTYRQDAFELASKRDNAPGVAGDMRTGLLIHDGNRGVTAGCIGILGDFEKFKKDMQAEMASAGGKLRLQLGVAQAVSQMATAPSVAGDLRRSLAPRTLTAGTWTSWEPRWQALDGNARAAAMAWLETGGDPETSRNVLAAMHNRASKNGLDLGSHVGTRLYQPSIERSQYERFMRLDTNAPAFKSLIDWSARYGAGQLPDPTGGATHFLVPPQTMLRLEVDNPSKYASWRGWTKFDPKTLTYGNQTFADRVHNFLAPEGRHSLWRP